MSNAKKSIFTWLYRIFCYFIPCGIALWVFLIDNLLNKEIGIMTKMGMSGLLVLAIIFLISIYFYKKYLKTSITKLTNDILECLDVNKKKTLIAKKRKFEARQEIFNNVCFVAPFVLIWLLCSLIETKVISLRGTFMLFSISMAIGLGFNCIAQSVKIKQ
jgi:hypothetical protein